MDWGSNACMFLPVGSTCLFERGLCEMVVVMWGGERVGREVVFVWGLGRVLKTGTDMLQEKRHRCAPTHNPPPPHTHPHKTPNTNHSIGMSMYHYQLPHTNRSTPTYLGVADGVAAGPGEDELPVERLEQTAQLIVRHDLLLLF
jgi:hypothetical protein